MCLQIPKLYLRLPRVSQVSYSGWSLSTLDGFRCPSTTDELVEGQGLHHLKLYMKLCSKELESR